MRDVQLLSIAVLQATATAFGGMKFDDFRKFLEKLEVGNKLIDVSKTIEEMKAKGLPIEDK